MLVQRRTRNHAAPLPSIFPILCTAIRAVGQPSFVAIRASLHVLLHLTILLIHLEIGSLKGESLSLGQYGQHSVLIYGHRVNDRTNASVNANTITITISIGRVLVTMKTQKKWHRKAVHLPISVTLAITMTRDSDNHNHHDLHTNDDPPNIHLLNLLLRMSQIPQMHQRRALTCLAILADNSVRQKTKDHTDPLQMLPNRISASAVLMILLPLLANTSQKWMLIVDPHLARLQA